MLAGGEVELRPGFDADDFGDELTPELREREERLREREELLRAQAGGGQP